MYVILILHAHFGSWYPPRVIGYLKSALEINYDRHAPVSVVLPLFKLLEESFAASNVIWEFSPHKMAHPLAYADMLERGGELRKAVRNGRIFEEDTISWDMEL